MKRTPEGAVKDRVKAVIAKYRPLVYAHWPVQNGMGTPTLDCNGCANSLYFTIECKGDMDLNPTPRQQRTLDEVKAARGKRFVIRAIDDPELDALDRWFALVCSIRPHVVPEMKTRVPKKFSWEDGYDEMDLE